MKTWSKETMKYHEKVLTQIELDFEEIPPSFLPIAEELTPEETADLEALYTHLLVKMIDAETEAPTDLETFINDPGADAAAEQEA